MNILGISGSLRQASLNTMLLRAMVHLAPPGIDMRLCRGLGELPLFNPDIENPEPSEVANLRQQIVAADAVFIASPEYAHGVTGVLKNALDWMTGNESFVYKPVALLNTSARATHAQAALREILQTISARIIEGACLTVPLLGAGLDEEAVMRHPEYAPQLVEAMQTLSVAVKLA